MEKNTCLGILGESGSGKSVTCKSILNILNKNFDVKGKIIFNGKNLLECKEEEMRKIRGKEICMILQNPMTSFDPLYTIENQMIETFLEHKNFSQQEAVNLAKESLEKMRLKDIDSILKKYPHELSGGMLQRIMIAIAIALKPKLIIADEPTTAIDSLNQKDIIEEFKILKKEFSISLIVAVVLAAINYLRLIILTKTPLNVALTVSVTLIFVVIISKIIGALLPIGAKVLKMDPAIMAGPLITTILDALTLTIYFKFATVFLKI